MNIIPSCNWLLILADLQLIGNYLLCFFNILINILSQISLKAFFNRKKDEADIRTESAEEGIKSAMFLLLLRLPQQKRFWVRDFITALRLKEKESYQTLAHTIEAGINDGNKC